MSDESSKKTFWHQLHGQMFNRKIERGMIVYDKEFIENTSLSGDKNPKSAKQYRAVIYDRSYVIEVLIKRVILPLYPMKWNDYQALLSEAYKTHKKRIEDAEKQANETN